MLFIRTRRRERRSDPKGNLSDTKSDEKSIVQNVRQRIRDIQLSEVDARRYGLHGKGMYVLYLNLRLSKSLSSKFKTLFCF